MRGGKSNKIGAGLLPVNCDTVQKCLFVREFSPQMPNTEEIVKGGD